MVLAFWSFFLNPSRMFNKTLTSVNAFDRLRFKCSREECQAEIVVDGLLTNSGDAEEVSRDQNLSFQLLKCSRADCDGKPFEELGRLTILGNNEE